MAWMLVSLHLIILTVAYVGGKRWLSLLIAPFWIATNLTVQLLIDYPIVGVSSVGALSYSIIYVVLALLEFDYGHKVAIRALHQGMVLFTMVTVLSFIAVQIEPVPEFNLPVQVLYQKFFLISLYPYLASLVATFTAGMVFLVLLKYLRTLGVESRVLAFFIAFNIAGALNSVFFFFGSLGHKMLSAEELSTAISLTLTNVVLKFCMSFVYLLPIALLPKIKELSTRWKAS